MCATLESFLLENGSDPAPFSTPLPHPWKPTKSAQEGKREAKLLHSFFMVLKSAKCDPGMAVVCVYVRDAMK